jgi:hypothetical protein
MRRVLLVVLLASCGTEATRPLTPAASAKPEPSLAGTWVLTDKDQDQGQFVVTTKGATVHVDVRGDKEPMTFEGHVSVLAGDTRVLNLRALEDGKPKGSWLFVRYAFNADGTLELWLVSDKLAGAALDAGTLKGKRGQYGGVTLDDTPEKIIAFIVKAKREEVFEHLATLKRSDTPR